MKIELLQAIIAAWPTDEAARLCDGHNTIIAQNAASLLIESSCDGRGDATSASTCRDDFWNNPETRTLNLVDQWRLQTRPIGEKLRHSHDPAHILSERPIEVQELARGVAHELRNPLAAIVTAAGLLQDDAEASEETLLLLNVIRKESRRMNRILTEFAAYVKPRPAQLEPFDATQIVREEARDILQNSGSAQPEFQIDDKLPDDLLVHIDIEQFREVVVQILQNAREAMPQGGRIELSGHGEEGKVLLSITDNGSGLSAEALKDAFQPFFSSKSHSTGLGLSIARSAIEASGGKIWIENVMQNNSDGVRVSLELPAPL